MKNYLIIVFCLTALIVRANDFNVLDFGAVADGKTLTTKAIQDAVDQCNATGGGTVTLPAGTYLTTTVFLKDGVNLHIQKGATLLGSKDPNAFKGGVVFANNIQNAAITGLGTINGQGFKEFFPKSGPRHHNIFLLNCKNITVTDITLINSPTWVFRIRECDGVKIQGIRIYSFSNVNNDGIDIEGKNIVLSDCVVDCDDDAICLKSERVGYMVENIAITNCVLGSICNAIKFGTASDAGFRNIAISNCVIRRPSQVSTRNWSEMIPGISNDTTVISGIALEIVDGGIMDHVTISNITMTGIQTPLFIKLGSRKGVGIFKNVVISNIIAADESLMTSSITGVPGGFIENFIIKDVIFNCRGTAIEEEAWAPVPERNSVGPDNRMFGYSLPAYGFYIRHVKNLQFENFRFNLRNPDARPAIVLDDCHGIRISNFSADNPTGDQSLLRVIQSTNVTLSGYHSTGPTSKFVRIEGEKSSNIKLTGNDFSQVKKVVDLGDGSTPGAVREIYNF
ncbi:MAG: glycosyl hydrolase family 28 protein [Prolixibacteraceae bacterium]|jgi:polygalacturonase|nr:glycosyl hydrolase family 28 protein [Prolixibacteraceae bacterium]